MIPLNAQHKYTQGVYLPANPKKYVGNHKPLYRSGYELRFFRWCDNNPNILEWASEAIIIPYLHPLDNKIHKYHLDGVIALKEGTGVVKYIIEIKPSSQVIPPTATARKSKKSLLFENQQYIVNTAKWNAAREWASRNNMKFQILTEKELGIK